MSNHNGYYPSRLNLGDSGKKGPCLPNQPQISLVVIDHNASRWYAYLSSRPCCAPRSHLTVRINRCPLLPVRINPSCPCFGALITSHARVLLSLNVLHLAFTLSAVSPCGIHPPPMPGSLTPLLRHSDTSSATFPSLRTSTSAVCAS